MHKIKRVLHIVLDACGCGNAPDAAMYGDEGANTLLHVVEKKNPDIPNLMELGLAGLTLTEPCPTDPHGVPPEVIEEFERETGMQVIGNKPASGTEIIQELGDEHYVTGKLIVYTSADSVFQIAAHEDVIPPSELYYICRIVRRATRCWTTSSAPIWT